MSQTVSDRQGMVAGMTPTLQPGRFVFVTQAGAVPPDLLAAAQASFREAEGLSLIVPLAAAEAAGLTGGPVMRQITLAVASSLTGVGLTAAVAGALAAAGIACNMVAAYHHDHVFLPEGDAETALAVLLALQAEARAGAGAKAQAQGHGGAG